jgi:hypothetical protein
VFALDGLRRSGDPLICAACGREISGEPLVIGGLLLCPDVCIPEPTPDISAQAERYAAERASNATGGTLASPVLRALKRR